MALDGVIEDAPRGTYLTNTVNIELDKNHITFAKRTLGRWGVDEGYICPMDACPTQYEKRAPLQGSEGLIIYIPLSNCGPLDGHQRYSLN